MIIANAFCSDNRQVTCSKALAVRECRLDNISTSDTRELLKASAEIEAAVAL